MEFVICLMRRLRNTAFAIISKRKIIVKFKYDDKYKYI